MEYQEYDLLIEMLNELKLGKCDFDPEKKFKNSQQIAEELYKKVQNIKRIEHGRKHKATVEANRSKVSESKKKINNAINLLRLESKEITPYAVAKTAGISYNTAKKYLSHLPSKAPKPKTLFDF